MAMCVAIGDYGEVLARGGDEHEAIVAQTMGKEQRSTPKHFLPFLHPLPTMALLPWTWSLPPSSWSRGGVLATRGHPRRHHRHPSGPLAASSAFLDELLLGPLSLMEVLMLLLSLIYHKPLSFFMCMCVF